MGFLFAAVELHSNQTVAKARKKLEPWFLNEETSDLSRVAHFVSAANMIFSTCVQQTALPDLPVMLPGLLQYQSNKRVILPSQNLAIMLLLLH